MGMAASQVRLLQLTSRKFSIGRQLESLSLQKDSLSRDMRRVSQNYQDAISSKILKWTTNAGVSTVDLSYATLMTPNATNQNTPYLLTNSSGKVLIDSKYLEYAKMISPDGAPGGNWADNRAAIISSLTGISPEQIENAKATSEAKYASEDKINQLQEEADSLRAKCTKKYSEKDLMKNCMGTIKGFNYQAASSGDNSNTTNSVYDDYIKENPNQAGLGWAWSLGTTQESSKEAIRELTNQLVNNMSNYLHDDDLKKFKEACENTCEIYDDFIDVAKEDTFLTGVQVSKSSQSGKYSVNIRLLIDNILSEYRNLGGSATQSTQNAETYSYEYTDRTSAEYQAYAAKQAELDAALAEYDTIVDNDNQALDASQERQIAFYDQLFTAVAERGWAGDSQLDDNEYLNNMLQNNIYYITTMTQDTDENGKVSYDYKDNIATNLDYIVSVNDTNAINEAQVQYEYEKSIINEKETRIDTRMQNLETEQSAIQQMIQGIETVEKDNIERHLNIFS